MTIANARTKEQTMCVITLNSILFSEAYAILKSKLAIAVFCRRFQRNELIIFMFDLPATRFQNPDETSILFNCGYW